MHYKPQAQRGGSTIVTLIILAIVGIGGYIGFQYVPQYMEAKEIDSILASVEKAYDENPVDTEKQIRGMINKRLMINKMKDMEEAFTIADKYKSFTITVDYERELNLLYEKRTMKYEKKLVLKK